MGDIKVEELVKQKSVEEAIKKMRKGICLTHDGYIYRIRSMPLGFDDSEIEMVFSYKEEPGFPEPTASSVSHWSDEASEVIDSKRYCLSPDKALKLLLDGEFIENGTSVFFVDEITGKFPGSNATPYVFSIYLERLKLHRWDYLRCEAPVNEFKFWRDDMYAVYEEKPYETS